MAMRTPAWWYRKDAQGAPWWRPLLWPLSLIWRAVNALKRATAKPYRAALRVISVGNLTLGGSGKTPVTAELLRFLGDRAVGLSRGHGGRLSGPLLVDPARHSAADVGDEALMLARHHDIFVSRDRATGLRAIEATATDTVVLDDAHQNPTIVKDIHILVVDGDTKNDAWPFGDEGVCPYGPMREPFAVGFARANLSIIWLPSEDATPDPDLLAKLAEKPVFIARLVAEPVTNRPHVLGFAAIAKPWKFEATLRRLGYEVVEFASFPDHAPLSDAQLEALYARAEKQLAMLITTEKDWVRLSPGWRERIQCLPIRARFDTPEALQNALGDKPAPEA
ncbi:tetraacyldisaccharide 4'-kinase [Asticcacaulis sp. EMRT-3]|uniref:tetraacyldisaccharide 4'-kinase n=1 Tax=Asticcacaulis sp. EMRT-3 TaxID=3040349 RepID=UPI0024AF1CD4|nr:tetraacyldisaccharide 4'-kinase [Asticcacaulis sp. EMRT-3]MDI7774085.1 tetraacyldisaccharide 4'-kinase [Asticcacaulis sp. EMRT-3]